jgi:hypothetical protein
MVIASLNLEIVHFLVSIGLAVFRNLQPKILHLPTIVLK